MNRDRIIAKAILDAQVVNLMVVKVSSIMHEQECMVSRIRHEDSQHGSRLH